MAIPVILDVDPGSDDAVAIMLAINSELIDLKAICTVAGNKSIDNTTENALRVVEKMNSDVPVYKGCSKPVYKHFLNLKTPGGNQIEITVNGEKISMHEDFLNIEPARRTCEEKSAPAFYVEFLKHAEEAVTVIMTGPVSNLAIALMMDPSIVDNINELVIMGGGYAISNISSSAEANIYNDPHALDWILNSGVKLTMIPLDATYMAAVPFECCEELRSINTFATNFAADLIEQRIKVHNATDPLDNSAPVHDALAVCAVINPDILIRCPKVRMDVETLPGKTFGQTIVDLRPGAKGLNCNFAFAADKNLFCEMLKQILGS